MSSVVKLGGVAKFSVYPDGHVTTKCADCGLIMSVPNRLFPEEQDVIEAARNLTNEPETIEALRQAVEALEAAEKEE